MAKYVHTIQSLQLCTGRYITSNQSLNIKMALISGIFQSKPTERSRLIDHTRLLKICRVIDVSDSTEEKKIIPFDELNDYYDLEIEI